MQAAEELYVSLVQTDLYWEEVGANLAMLEEKIWPLRGATDLILLPEMFSTGFSMNAKQLAEPMHLTTYRWMRQQAEQTKAVLVGSYIVSEGGNFFNRLFWVSPDGATAYYDKKHLFGMAGEQEVYTAGNKPLICTLKGWRISPFICYDLRFPVWCRNVAMQYDVLCYIASWGAPRIKAWSTLLRARAIENLSYCIGVNRIGVDGMGYRYTGASAAIDMAGKELFDAQESEIVHTQVLHYSELQSFRSKFPFGKDADAFLLT